MKKKVLIVGGGIAGVTLAGLIQDQYEVTVVEKSSEWRTIGYAVCLWKNGIDILKKLDLPKSFWDQAYPSHTGSIFGERAQKVINIDFSSISDGVITQAVTRESLHVALIEKLRSVTVYFNTTCTSIDQDNLGVTVVFSNGKKERFDMVVGADGVYSQVREHVFGLRCLRPYNWCVWYGWVSREHELTKGWYSISHSKELLL